MASHHVWNCADLKSTCFFDQENKDIQTNYASELKRTSWYNPDTLTR